jgi:hypothetical protein
MEDLHHVRLPHARAPPRLTAMPPSIEPRWQDLPPNRQEELLRLLGQMLADRLAVADADKEVTHDCS